MICIFVYLVGFCTFHPAKLLCVISKLCLLFLSAVPARLRVLKNGESDHSRAVTVVGPDLTNVSNGTY